MKDRSLVGDRTVDLSPQGMLVLSDENIDLGDELFVSFLATDFPIWFDTHAVVTRVVEGRRPHDLGRALGLTFRSLPSVSRLILRGHLRNHPQVPPHRELPIDLVRTKQPNYAHLIQQIAGYH